MVQQLLEEEEKEYKKQRKTIKNKNKEVLYPFLSGKSNLLEDEDEYAYMNNEMETNYKFQINDLSLDN